MFYLFLDVDGVLNKESDWKIPFSIDRSCVKAMEGFISKTKEECRIVLVSTWRAGAARSAGGFWQDGSTGRDGGAGQSSGTGQSGNSKQYDRLCRVLEDYNLSIFDATPISSQGRQAEVEFYIRRNQVKHYLVIDDDPSLYEAVERLCFYAPDYKTGFTQKDIRKAMKQLRMFP